LSVPYSKPNSKCVVLNESRRNTSGMPNPTQKCDAQRLFAANMRRIRKAKELTQEKIAELAELHPNYVSSVERGERNISICNIERIAKALGVTMAELVAAPVRDAEATAVAPGDAPR
jgi:ribosome-binding protein aMBF1 (putative translation factor)